MLGSNYLGQSYFGQGYPKSVPASTTGLGKLALIGSTGNTSLSYTPSTSWTRRTLTFTAASTDVYVDISGSDSTRVQWVDGVQLELGSQATNYFDGSYGYGYKWVGTANTSASTLTPFLVAVAAPSSLVSYGVQISWPKAVVTSSFFTIGVSRIGGSDVIKSGGAAVTFFDRYAYTDYSNYLVAMSVSQNIGQYPFGIVSTQATLQLDNSDYLFTPGVDPTIGAYILPGRPVKLSMGYGGESLQQFTGFTDQPLHTRSDLSLSMTASDVMSYITNYVSALTSVLVNQTTTQIIAAALAEMGFSSAQYNLDASLQPAIAVLAPFGQQWGTLLNYMCEVEQGLLFVDEYGIITFWNHNHLTGGTSVWQIDATNLEDLKGESTPIFNDVIVVANPRAVATKQRVWVLPSAVSVPASGNVVYRVDFSDGDGALPVTTMDTPVAYTSATTSSFRANTAADGSGTDATSSVTLSAVTPRGTSCVMTINNSSGSVVYVTAMSIYGTPAPVVSRISVRQTDSTSVITYGLNPANNSAVLELDNDYIQSQTQASNLSANVVAQFKDGRQRYLATVTPNPAIQMGDTVQVLNPDSSILKTVYVTGRALNLAVGDFSQTLELEERI